MPAHPIIAAALCDSYTLEELQASQKSILDAALSPDSLSGEQLDGVSFQFMPRTMAELTQTLENLASAIAKLEDPTAAGDVRSRFFDFRTRPIE